MQRKFGLCVVNAWQKATPQKCRAFTTQSSTFRCIPKFFLSIEVNPHIWFQQRFLISGRNSTTLFGVVEKASDVVGTLSHNLESQFDKRSNSSDFSHERLIHLFFVHEQSKRIYFFGSELNIHIFAKHLNHGLTNESTSDGDLNHMVI